MKNLYTQQTIFNRMKAIPVIKGSGTEGVSTQEAPTAQAGKVSSRQYTSTLKQQDIQQRINSIPTVRTEKTVTPSQQRVILNGQNAAELTAERNRLTNEAMRMAGKAKQNDVTTWAEIEKMQQQASEIQKQLDEMEVKKANVGQLVGDSVMRGISGFDKGITSTMDWMIGNPLKALGWEDNPVSALNRTISSENEYWTRRSAENTKNDRAAQIAGEVATGTVAAIPQAALAFMTAGASLGTQATTAGLEATAMAENAPGLANTIGTAVRGMAKDPQYWLSFLQTAGESYESAREDGQNDLKASAYAMTNGLLNALVEVGGGGIQNLPENLQRDGGTALKEWISSAIDEGKEEVVQGVIERGLQNLIYGANNPVFSAKDERAVFNPKTAAKEFGMGAAVGGILGGGQMAANNIVRGFFTPAEYQELVRQGVYDDPELMQNLAASPSGEGRQDGQTLGKADADAQKTAPAKGTGANSKTATVEEHLRNHIFEMARLRPVAELTGNELPSQGRASDRVMAFLESVGNKVTRIGFGDVLFSKSKIKSALVGHGSSAPKIETIAAVPEVIKYGIELDHIENYEGRGYDSYIFGAPVTYKNKPVYVGVVVTRDKVTGRYYVHEVVDSDGNLLLKSTEPKGNSDRTPRTEDSPVIPLGSDDVTITNNPTAVKERGSGREEDAATLRNTVEWLSSGEYLRSIYETGGIDALVENEEKIEKLEQMIRETLSPLEEAEYRASRAEEDAERAYADAEQAGKKIDQTQAPKAPKSRANLKRRIQELFNIQEGSKGRVNEIVDVIADELQTTGDISETRMERLFDAIYGHGTVTREADGYFRNFRDSVRGSKIYVSDSVRTEFGDDWRAFVQEARRNGITLTENISDGGIDVHAAELSEIYGEGLFPSDTDLKSQLETIVDTAARGKGETLTNEELDDILRGEWGDEAVQKKLDAMERKFMVLLDTFQQSAGIESEAREQAERKVQRAKESANLRKQKAKEQIDLARRRADQRVEAAQQRAEEKVAKYKEMTRKYIEGSRKLAKQQMEKRALSELRNKTQKALQWLKKNRNRAPANLRAQYDEVLEGINTITINAANEMQLANSRMLARLGKENAGELTYRDVAEVYKAAQKSDPNFLPSAELDKLVERLDYDAIGDMDVDALNNLYKAASALRTEFYNRNNVINDALGRTFSEAYHASVDEINSAKGPATRGEKWFNIEQMTPMNVLERMSGWIKDSTFYSFAKQLESGEREYKRYTVAAQKALAGFLDKNADWARRADGQGKDAIWYRKEVHELLELNMGDKPVLSDKTVTVWFTPAQKVHMAMEAENYDNLRHMAGGRTFADRELYSQGKRRAAFAKGTTIKLAPETVKEMVSDLTPEEKNLYNILKKFYNGTAKDEINRVSNALYGYDRAMTRNYAPIFTNQNYVGHEPGIWDATAEGVGHLKSRQYSKNPSYQISAFDAFERHTDQTARFVGYAIPIRNFNTLMNWRESGNQSFRDTISHKWEDAGTDYIDQLLEDIQNAKYDKNGNIDTGTNKILSNYISAVFGANPGIVLKQAASFPQAASVLGYETMPNIFKMVDTDLIGKYTPELAYRLLGYATPETAAIKNNPGILDRNRVTRFLFRGGAITAMDGATVKRIWPWAENYVSKNFPELRKGTQAEIDAGESPYYKKVAEMFNEAVSLTQPMYDTMHRANIMQDSKGIKRALTMFKTVPLQQYNTLRKAFGELSAAKRGSPERKIAARNAANSVTATLASVAMLEAVEILNQLWKNGMKGYRDDDDELTAGSIAEKFAKNAINDLAGIVVGGKEFSSFLQAVFLKEKWYDIEMPGIEQWNDILAEIQSAVNVIHGLITDATDIVNDGGDLDEYFHRHGADYAGAVKEIAETAAIYLKGLPAENVEKYLVGTLRLIAPEIYIEVQDFFSTPDRTSLKGLKGKQLETRVSNILENRFGKMPDGATAELSRLYSDYGSSVILPDTPSSVTIGGQDIKLDAGTQQKYDVAYKEAAKVAVAGLRTNQDYLAMNNEERVAYLKKVYDAASEYARLETIPEYGEANSDKKEKFDGLKAAGISTARSVEVMAMKSALSSVEFSYWIENAGFPGKTLEKIKDVLNISTTTYDDFKAAGLHLNDIVDLTIAMSELEPEEGKKSVTSYQKYRAILNGDFSPDVSDKAMKAMMSKSTYDGYLKVKQAGLALKYIDALEIMNSAEGEKDSNGETIAGSVKFSVMQQIDKISLSSKKKELLFEALGYDGENMWNTEYKGDDYETYYYMSDGAKKSYNQYCSWMDVKVFSRRYDICKEISSDRDANGKEIKGQTRKDKIIRYINSLPLSDDQKTAMYAAMGYSQSTVDDCPWWNKNQMHGIYYPW